MNKIGYLFFRDGARLRTSAKRLLAPEPSAPSVRAAPHFFGARTLKTAPMTAPKKCSRQTTRLCSGTHRVYPALCFDFINCPILFILHPFLFTCKTRGHGNGHFPATQLRKIPHAIGNLPTVMQPQQHCYLPDPQRSAVTDAQLAAPMQPHYEEW